MDDSFKLPAVTSADIAVWKDRSGAGAEYSEAEDSLSETLSCGHAVVVGEFVPKAAEMARCFAAFDEKGRDNSRLLTTYINWLAYDQQNSPCIVVRLIDDTNNLFHVLTQKDPSDGICRIRAAPSQGDTLGYIAIYDEWAGHCRMTSPSLRIKLARDSLTQFCAQYREKCQAVKQARADFEKKNRDSISKLKSQSKPGRTPPQVQLGSDGQPGTESASMLDISLAHLFTKDVEYTDSHARHLLTNLRVCL